VSPESSVVLYMVVYPELIRFDRNVIGHHISSVELSLQEGINVVH
jgi:hypothetical protein